jgi:hypothetical protein
VYIDPRTSEWRPAEPLSAGASSNPQSPATPKIKVDSNGQAKPRRDAARKMMSQDNDGVDVPYGGGIPSLAKYWLAL